MKSLIAATCVVAYAEAYVSHAKAAFLKSKGVNMEGVHERHDKIATRSQTKRLAVQRQAGRIRVAQAERERVAAEKALAEKEHKLKQRYGGYGSYGGYGGYSSYGNYGGYGGYSSYGNYGGYSGYDNYGSEQRAPDSNFDDYGNELENDEQEGVDIPIAVENLKPLDYYENMVYGVIDGMTADFDANCKDSMYGVVGGGFSAFKYKNVAKPSNTIKFQMGLNQFTESTNSVYTYCDFTHFFNQLAVLADWEDWEQYIQVGSRSMGSFVQNVPQKMKCISRGQAGLNGYDVGLCGGGIVGLLLDTKL